MQEEETPAEEQPEAEQKKQNKILAFLTAVLQGAAIGLAFIIPGFSGGSIAAILGVYEKIVNAVADLFKNFKKNILFLLPIALGMILGVAALILPIQWGLKHFPVPTVSLFVGLALGGLPSVAENCKGGKVSWKHVLACVIPLAAAAGLCFLPHGREVELLSLDFGGYLLLFLVGAVGSCALVVPGISGSMLLLIFGYYNPLVSVATKEIFQSGKTGVALLVLFTVALGILVGFFGISFLMKFLLKKFPRGTYFAILGFIVGSIPAVFVSVANGEPLAALMPTPWHWVVAVVLFVAGAAISYALVRMVKKKKKRE